MTTKVEELRKLAQTIKNETKVGGNTAERVGNAFKGVADALEGNEQKINDISKNTINKESIEQTTGDSETSVMSQKATTKMLVDYDVSAANGGQSYTIDEAISKIPLELQKGGLTIVFVDSSSGVYTRYFLKSSTWSTDINKWIKNCGETELIELTNAEYNEQKNNLNPSTIYAVTSNPIKVRRDYLRLIKAELPLGVIPKADCDFVLKIYKTNNSLRFFELLKTNEKTNNFKLYGDGSNYEFYFYGKSELRGSLGVGLFEIKKTGKQLFINGTSIGSFTSTPKDLTSELMLSSTFDFYELNITNNGIEHTFVPYTIDGEDGFYDTTNDVFVTGDNVKCFNN